MVKEKTVKINLPAELAGKIATRMEEAGFSKISDYATYVLEQVLANLEKTEPQSDPPSEDEQRKVQERMKRLQSLGYLD